MSEVPSLGALGIDEAEELAYELLLGHPHSPADLLARFWERDEDLEAALAALTGKGLAERLPGDPPRYLALPPGVALGGRLTDLERQFKAARDHVTELTVAYHRHRAAPDRAPDTVIETVTGRAAVLQRLGEIRSGVRAQVRSLDEAPNASLPGADASRPLAEGISRRAIYGSAVIGEDIEEVTRAGQQVRMLPAVPLPLYLVDDELALLPTRPPSVGTLVVVHRSALLGSLSDLFESLWSRALPLPSGQADQTPADRQLISLLLAGLTDTASARHLGVSQRTVQRRVAALLDELGVQTRFQAGAKLAFRDGEQLRVLVDRRLVDLLDRGLELRVELLVGLTLREVFEQRPREARDERGVLGEQGARLIAGVPAGQRDDPQDARVLFKVPVQAGLGGDGDLHHDRRVARKRRQVLGDGVVQDRLGLLLVRALDADLGLQDRHQAGLPDPLRVRELLVDDRFDTGRVGVGDERPHLGAEHVVPVRLLELVVQRVDGLHELHVVLDGGQAEVDLQERHHVLGFPQVLTAGDALDVAFHRLYEQDRPEHP
jgi:DNA-binding CsgD family transcriptional regulator